MREIYFEKPSLGSTATFVPICDRCGGTILSPYEVSNGVSISDVTKALDYLAEPYNEKYEKCIATYHELCVVKDETVIKRLVCPHCGAAIDIVRIPFGMQVENGRKGD